ncbi:unnamed protein product, partial [Mycena citricolor]
MATRSNRIEPETYLEIENCILIRKLKHVLRNTMRQNLIAVSTFRSHVDSLTVCVKLCLQPWDENPATHKPNTC